MWRVSQPKKTTDGSSESGFKPKDIVISVYNVSRKGKRKLLAKNRFDLFRHGGQDVETVAEAESACNSLRFKLYPETKKVVKCSVNVALSHGERNKPMDGTVAEPNIIQVEDGESIAPSTISSRRSSINLKLAQNDKPPEALSSPSLSVASSQIGLPPVNRAPSPPIPTPASPAAVLSTPGTHPSSNVLGVKEDKAVVKSPTSQVIEDFLKDFTPPLSTEKQPSEIRAIDDQPANSADPTPGTQGTSVGTVNGSESPQKVLNEISLPVGEISARPEKNDERKEDPPLPPPSPSTPPPLTPPRMPSFRLDVSVRTPETNGNNRILKAMTPGKPSETERLRTSMSKDELMEWAKSRLEKYNQIKITNLSSSWRSGLALCSLIHSAYPELIPLSHLKAFNADKVNCPLALSASKMIGVDMGPPLAESIADIKLKPDVVAVYLERLKVRLERRKEFSDSELQQWRRSCYERFELWANEFMVQSPVESRPQSIVKSPDPQERPKSIVDLQERPKSIVLEGSPSENRKRVKELIAQAHLSMSSSQEDDTTPPQSAFAESAVDPIGSRQGSTVTLAGAMTTSVTLDEIATEMAKLEQEREYVDIEMKVLQQFMREDDSDDKERLERWLVLVNEKNALDRRQMQLNIKEKEASISRRHNAIMAELQKVTYEVLNNDAVSDYVVIYLRECLTLYYVSLTDIPDM